MKNRHTDTRTRLFKLPALLVFFISLGPAEKTFAQGTDFSSARQISLGSGNLTLNRAGNYVLSGTLRNGQVLIDVGKNEVVRIRLNGVYIENPSGAAIYMAGGAELVINLAEGTENTLVDGAAYVFSAGEDEPKAVIFVKNNLTVNGTGKLTVRGNYRNGIHAKDNLVVNAGEITVNAVEEAIQGGDSVTISGGTFNLSAGNDGIKSSNTDAGKGIVTINGGTFTIKAGRDAVQADNNLIINGGNFTVSTGNGAAASSRQGAGDWGRNRSQPANDADSMKAFKAGQECVVNRGTFVVDAQDDAFHSNGNLTVKGGTFTVKTGDDAFHADNALRIEGGTINISASFEGIEGKTIDISGGDITVVSTDDAINAADGSAASGAWGGRRSSSSGIYTRISGGVLNILAAGDGVDANGDLFLSGGELYISGPSMGMQGAIDLDGSFTVSGGRLIAAGSSLSPSSRSTQPVLLVSYTSVRNRGSVISVRDKAGRSLLEYTAQADFTASAFSSPEFQTGQTYGLYINNRKITDISLGGTVTALSDNGGPYSLRGYRRW